MPMNKDRGTYWECRLCRCSWSGGIDIGEMREHYLEDHPEVELQGMVDEEDYMQRKISSGFKKKKHGR
jgi:hypothetical protein